LKYSLLRHWKEIVAMQPRLLHPLQHFFQTCLLIPDAGVEHYLDDLVEIKGLPEEEQVPSVIKAHYAQLLKFASEDDKAATAVRYVIVDDFPNSFRNALLTSTQGPIFGGEPDLLCHGFSRDLDPSFRLRVVWLCINCWQGTSRQALRGPGGVFHSHPGSVKRRCIDDILRAPRHWGIRPAAITR
jgi:hypothetical protein